jgi:hypothetical protein
MDGGTPSLPTAQYASLPRSRSGYRADVKSHRASVVTRPSASY